MVNRIGTVYLYGTVYSWVRYETLEESRRTYRPKRCKYKNKDEFNSPYILSNSHSIKFIQAVKYFVNPMWLFLHSLPDKGGNPINS